MTNQVPSNEALSELFQYVIDLSHDMDVYHSQKLMEVAGVIGGVIASRAPRDHLPSKDLVAGLQKIRRRVSGELDGTWMLHSEAVAVLAEIERLQVVEVKLEINAAVDERLDRVERELAGPACKGKNCGSTDPRLHSADCFEEHERTIGAAQPPGDSQ